MVREWDETKLGIVVKRTAWRTPSYRAAFVGFPAIGSYGDTGTQAILNLLTLAADEEITLAYSELPAGFHIAFDDAGNITPAERPYSLYATSP